MLKITLKSRDRDQPRHQMNNHHSEIKSHITDIIDIIDSSSGTPPLNIKPSALPTQLTFVGKFRNVFQNVYPNDTHLSKCWFWDNFNWNQNSIWIGKHNCPDDLPQDDEKVKIYLTSLLENLNQSSQLQANIYMKFYLSRNVETDQPEINYLLLCNHQQLPLEFINTQVNQEFEKYQLTERIINLESEFKNLVNHYLNWNNFYIYYNLMTELQY